MSSPVSTGKTRTPRVAAAKAATMALPKKQWLRDTEPLTEDTPDGTEPMAGDVLQSSPALECGGERKPYLPEGAQWLSAPRVAQKYLRQARERGQERPVRTRSGHSRSALRRRLSRKKGAAIQSGEVAVSHGGTTVAFVAQGGMNLKLSKGVRLFYVQAGVRKI